MIALVQVQRPKSSGMPTALILILVAVGSVVFHMLSCTALLRRFTALQSPGAGKVPGTTVPGLPIGSQSTG
jgi:hypothetical protein